MPATGKTPIQLYRSGTTGVAPVAGNLELGELALNYTDGFVFYKDGSGNILRIGENEKVYDLTGTAIDPANGTIQTKTIAADTTFTESLADGQSVVLMLTDAGSHLITWPSVTWVSSGGNVAPTLTASDVVVLWKVGSTVYGLWSGSYATV